MRSTVLGDFSEVPLDKVGVPLITVYESPKDFEGKFVGRLFDLNHPTEYCVVKDTLADVRAVLPKGFVKVGREEQDDPVIVEVWLWAGLSVAKG